ncbi:MAG: hypothetical protein ACYDAJ_08095 [Nitrosotalea sp.]
MRFIILIGNQIQGKTLSKIMQQTPVKEKRDDKLCPKEEKVAKLYKAGKLKGKTFQSDNELNEDLHDETIKKRNVVKN